MTVNTDLVGNRLYLGYRTSLLLGQCPCHLWDELTDNIKLVQIFVKVIIKFYS